MKNTIKDINIEADYNFLLQVSKAKLDELGLLQVYMDHRGGNKFNEDGYDYITILQAKLIGLVK
ncbi:hypothetical protein [Sphingobacterium sp.]|uniref:hypothetical protein n=1 Tax=Sphingobacterium sp. TaxID=341027 RepID=UPI00289F4732|nr:hypothetical protein [Sphingobacterium sp.]